MSLTCSRFLFYALVIFLLINLGHIILHDFICHEELHQLVNPVHHYFKARGGSSQDLVPLSSDSSGKIFLQVIDFCPSDFTPSIFHPPD